ncbi:MAG: XRE family transcriptional regulator [Proteobacteria bacterium]|nr:XRE family transcriptional regulator [Pseudomonadota bacterium]
MKTKVKARTNKKEDFIDELASMMSPERAERAKSEAEKEIFHIRLSELRKKMGIRQEDIKSFTQSGISKLESRSDMKVSTLIEYLKSIGMGVEIKAYSKKVINKNIDAVTLLKV